MKTLSHIIALVTLLMPVMASANNYESRIKEALEKIAKNANNSSSIGITYNAQNDPETGQNDGELRIAKFKLGPREAHLID